MTVQEGAADVCHMGKVMELMLLLPTNQFLALEKVAYQQNMSVARLLRRAISDLLRQSG
jgi:hypothetical protein